jgi:hypothetical protein
VLSLAGLGPPRISNFPITVIFFALCWCSYVRLHRSIDIPSLLILKLQFSIHRGVSRELGHCGRQISLLRIAALFLICVNQRSTVFPCCYYRHSPKCSKSLEIGLASSSRKVGKSINYFGKSLVTLHSCFF